MTIKLRKIILVWGLVLFLSGIASPRPNPKICRSRNGKFPRAGTSCRGYYECQNYNPLEKTCADGEHFNANKGWCDWEDLYPCLEKQKDKECVRENGLFLKPGTDCRKYYRCCNGKAKEEICPGGSLFDPSKENCEWPDLYTCIEKQEWKKCPNPNGLFLKPKTNCKKYYYCTNGKPHEKCCEKNTLFNPSSGKCEPLQIYTCLEPSERKECPRRNGQFLKPRTNCRKYYICSNGEPEEHQCSKNTLFNPATEKCESAELYICIEKPERKECPKRNGKFLKPGTNCVKYYNCSNGEPEERKCLVGTLFNPSTENCEKIEIYTCTETPDKNKCTRRNGKFLKPGTGCKEYYKCSDGRPKIKECERNMLFNPSSERCESSRIYTCTESSSTTEKVSTTVPTFVTSTAPDDQNEKESTDPVASSRTFGSTTSSNQFTYSTQDPDFERTNSKILEITTESNIQTTPIDGLSTYKTGETPTISQTITSTISTFQPSTAISTSTESKKSTQTEVSTKKLELTTAKTSTLQSTTEISTSQSTTETSTSQSTTDISTLQPTTEPSTLQPTTETSTWQSTTEISTLQPTTDISTLQPTTETSTLQSTTEISTLQSTTDISTSQSTTQQASSEISMISQTTSPQMSSTHTTSHPISKEDKEVELTEPTVFETTEVTVSPSTVEITTSAETNIMCPEPNGYFPHPTDKHKFVVCVHNVPNILTCPSNLVFKPRSRRCDYE